MPKGARTRWETSINFAHLIARARELGIGLG